MLLLLKQIFLKITYKHEREKKNEKKRKYDITVLFIIAETILSKTKRMLLLIFSDISLDNL